MPSTRILRLIFGLVGSTKRSRSRRCVPGGEEESNATAYDRVGPVLYSEWHM